MTEKTQYLDLDAVLADEPEVVVKLNGKEHKLAPLSVKGFVENVKQAQALPTEPSIDQEVDMMVAVLLRSFPTMSRDELLKLNFSHLNRIVEFSQNATGQAAVEQEAAKDAAENPNKAGS